MLYEVVSKRSSIIEGTLTVQELNEILDLLSENIGKSWVVKFVTYYRFIN